MKLSRIEEIIFDSQNLKNSNMTLCHLRVVTQVPLAIRSPDTIISVKELNELAKLAKARKLQTIEEQKQKRLQKKKSFDNNVGC